MKVAIIGTGYVGLVSGVCFSDFGHTVTCVDNNPDKINLLNSGGVPIYEPGLDVLVAKNVKEGRLFFSTDLATAVSDADAVFIAVGTPERKEDGAADLTYVFAAAEDVAKAISGFTVIVTKSTVPVGTGDKVESVIKKANPKADFDVVSNPEFLREGAAIMDFKQPDRVVVGAETERAQKLMAELYRPFNLNAFPLLITNRRTSELIKYAGNAFLATKITFINEMADLCEKVGANVEKVARGIGLDTRIGPKFLSAGPGYGGSCFPKDTMAVVNTARAVGSPLKIIETVVEINAARKLSMADRIVAALGGNASGKTIAILGLAFKPDTDDMRDSPAIDIVNELVKAGATVRACDPEAMEEAKHMLPPITYCEDAYDCAKGADVVVIVTEWSKFKALDLSTLKELLNAPIMVDLRNVYDPDIMMELGFEYTSIGRPRSNIMELNY
jgi:UDPglucose 6-dehydrogenase